MSVQTAIIYVPASHRLDGQLADECLEFAGTEGLYAVPFRDVTVIDHLLNDGWSDLVIVARPHHAIAGWPVRVVSDVLDRRVVRFPPCGGKHRAPSDSLIGQVVRHPTCEIPIRRRPSAEELIDARVARWVTQFPEMRRSE
jgi:hypothetical protein